MSRPVRFPARDLLLAAALEEAGGATLVVDRELRLVLATPAAQAILGELPVGASVPAALCGEALERPVAEAMVAGRPVTATVPRPVAGQGLRDLRVRAVPVQGGWLVRLEFTARATGEVQRFHGMLTGDPAMQHLFELVRKVAVTDAPVLVRGETGAGKELVAQALHAESPRAAGPFRAINCAALPPALLESELFGHVRGAFTGAVRDNPGHFRQASGGTLFLDEVAELPLELQAKLLRVLETMTVIPVGGQEAIQVDVRIVSATHRALRQEVAAGRFRADLMYRLRVVPLYLPPLRDRPGDVAILARHFLDERAARGARRIEQLAPSALAALERHDWPGNVRELRNSLEYALVVGSGPVIDVADLPPEIIEPDRESGPPPAAVNVLPPLAQEHDPELARLRRALERTGGHRGRAARLLGMSRATLWRKLSTLDPEG